MINVDDRLLDTLNESEMYLIMHIAKRMQQNRMTAWPSIETLCKDCKWDDRTVKKWRQSLIDRGFLAMQLNPGRPTIYRFLKDGIGVFAGLKNDEGYTEKEGTKNEGGTFYEGTKNVVEGVHFLSPEVVNNNEVVNNPLKKETGAEKPPLVFEEQPSIPLKKERASRPREIDISLECQAFDRPDEIETLWRRWIKYRAEIKKPLLSDDSVKTGLKKLQKQTSGKCAAAVDIIEKSISNGWQGFGFDKEPVQRQQPYAKSGLNGFGGDPAKYLEKQKF